MKTAGAKRLFLAAAASFFTRSSAFIAFRGAESVGLRRARADARARTINANAGGSTNADAGLEVQAQTGRDQDKSGFEAQLEHMVLDLMSMDTDGKDSGPKASDFAAILRDRMDIGEAVQRLDGKLPGDVAALVKMASTDAKGKSAKGEFDENSLQKARRILNGMMEQAWKELDDVIFECKEFQERNRGTYDQVVGDLARLGSQLSLLGSRRVDASEGVYEADRLRKATEANLLNERSQFQLVRAANDAELTIRRNDLAVFDMILMMTKCADSSAAASSASSASSLAQVTSGLAEHSVKLCQSNDGLELHFNDPNLQAKVERLMTPEARKALREALGHVTEGADFIQSNSSRLRRQVPDDNVTTSTMAPPQDVVPVVEEPSPSGQAKKCVDGTPNCGLLHDLMSMEWGRFRDAFDELATEMKKNQDVHDNVMANLNQQMTVINDVRTQHMEVLADAISQINADTEEMNEKDEQKRELQQEYDKTMAIYHAQCTEILYTRICAVRKVRNEMLFHSTVSPPSKVTDCDFSDWHPKDGQCFGPEGNTIECDDSCPQDDPYKCGGQETMKRDVVQAPNSFGMKCPQLERLKKCKQIKCPVSCVLSEWSGWSKCSKECEGGVEVRTRAVMTKPKNGGVACDTVQEEQPCNTGSCDRDCMLDEWTDWSPCSMACGGGITSHKRKVMIPIRGEGRCPKARSADRFMQEGCNVHDCVGDEICIAKQDLILAIDGSGSLKEEGFETVRAFSANLTARYRAIYFGGEAMQIGVCLFGNGHLEPQPDGSSTIAAAQMVQGLTADISLVREAIDELVWARGFTNMAQAFGTADTMLSLKGRPDAQSAVMVISDGMYSMQFQTAQKAQELKDKNIMIYMVPITETKGKELVNLQKWASQPWETNYERIPGLAALAYNSEMFAQTIIAKFCPDAFSPTTLAQKEEDREFMMVHEGGQPDHACGRETWIGTGMTLDDCAQTVHEHNGTAFAFGRGRGTMDGACFMVGMEMSEELWEEWQSDRTNPPCPGGSWQANPYADTYVVKPM